MKRACAGVGWGPRGRVLTLVLVSQCASSCCTRMLSSAATQSHRHGLSTWQPGCATIVYLPKRSRICTVPVVTIVHGRQRARPPLEELHIAMTGLERVLVVGGALREATSRWYWARASCCVRCRSIRLGGSGWRGGSGARGAGRCDSVGGCGTEYPIGGCGTGTCTRIAWPGCTPAGTTTETWPPYGFCTSICWPGATPGGMVTCSCMLMLSRVAVMCAPSARRRAATRGQ